MAQWPRLLATRIERRGLRGLFEEELEQLMLDTIRMDPNILSMAVAFEPGVFYRDASSPEPEFMYAHFAEWAKPSGDDAGADDTPSSSTGMLTSANTAPPAPNHTRHGRDAAAPRKATCDRTGSICYGDVTFNELLPPSYTPLYREWKWYTNPKATGQATWSDPYLDDGGANVPMVTYSVPLRQDGVFAGVATMDVVLDPTSTVGLSQPAADQDADAGAEATGANLVCLLCLWFCCVVLTNPTVFLFLGLQTTTPTAATSKTKSPLKKTAGRSWNKWRRVPAKWRSCCPACTKAKAPWTGAQCATC